MRCFISLPVAKDVVPALLRLQRRLGVGRVVPPENLHLTLAFLDNQSHEVLEAIHESLQLIQAPPFSVTLTGLDQFGWSVHLKVQENPRLDALHGRVQAAVRHAGIFLPRRRFRPHVTVLRLKPTRCLPPYPPDLTGLEYPEMEVSQFALYASTLLPDGARHECLAEYPLAPEN